VTQRAELGAAEAGCRVWWWAAHQLAILASSWVLWRSHAYASLGGSEGRVYAHSCRV
jgi:hypothetical protein